MSRLGRARARLAALSASLPVSVSLPRTLAVLASATLLASMLSILYGVVQVDGDPRLLLAIAGVSALAATVLARLVRVTVAVVLAAIVLAVGLTLYLFSLPYDPQPVAMIESNLKLLSGQSVLEIKRSTIWALSVAPTPVLVTWYLTVRGWYSTAALVGGATLGYFVLTGDATVVQTLLGVISGAALLGFGDLDHRDASLGAAEPVAVVLAVMVIAPLVVSVAPAGSASPLSFDDGGGAGTVEASIIETDATVDIAGSISLSPKVRYTVTSPEPRLWRVGSYDRYTGDGWIRTGDPEPLSQDALRSPPGPTRRVSQTFTAESTIETMPAAWRPVNVSGEFANRTQVTEIGGLDPSETLSTGDSYRVTSAVPRFSPSDLAGAPTEDPPAIASKYTQLPANTPDRVARRTETLTTNADNRAETARTVEEWLRTNREYSLDVERPDGNIADAFLFEMEGGYCTYYATTMVTMLRTQDIPARITVGYTPGEQVDSNEYVVRGYNSHAWVEVYFPEQGWVAFDPTPVGPRVAAEQTSLDDARENGTTNVDTSQTELVTPTTETNASAGSTPTPTPTPSSTNSSNATTPSSAPAGALESSGGAAGGDGSGLPELPSREQLVLGMVVLAGAVASVRRSILAERAYRAVWLRYLPHSEPASDIERAFERLAYLLERRHRPRREGETVRQYLDAIDADSSARRLATLRERARYGGDATPAMATEARELLARIRSRE